MLVFDASKFQRLEGSKILMKCLSCVQKQVWDVSVIKNLLLQGLNYSKVQALSFIFMNLFPLLVNPWINPFTPKSDFTDFTLSDARWFYSSKGDPLGVKGLID